MSTCGEKKPIGRFVLYVFSSGLSADCCPTSRPSEFAKSTAYPEDSDEEESIVGRMPPSDSEDDE